MTGADGTDECRRQVRRVALGTDAAVVEIGGPDGQEDPLGLDRLARELPVVPVADRSLGLGFRLDGGPAPDELDLDPDLDPGPRLWPDRSHPLRPLPQS